MEMEKYGIVAEKEMEVDDGSMAQSEDDSECSENDNTGVGRTYECNYCKRGFTNAQALGGHMNIHRKDKAKAKQQQQQQLQQQQQHNLCSSSSFSFKPSSMEFPLSAYSSSFTPQRMNYQAYNYATLLSSSQQPIYDHDHFSNTRTRLLGMQYDQDHLGTDLSLRINSSSIDDRFQVGGKENNNNNDMKDQEDDYNHIDLELRLGYHP